jgi:butyryl-CoA dehydrogenase
MAEPMPFELSGEQELIRRSAREFGDQVLAGLAEAADREARFPPEAAKGLAELGLAGLLVGQEHGGAGLDALSLVVVLEELARRSGGIATALLSHNLAARALAGSAHAELLPRLAAGQEWATSCLAEGPLAAQLQGSDALWGAARPFPLAGAASVAVLPHPAGGLAAVRGQGLRWVPESTLGLRSAAMGSLVLVDAPAARLSADIDVVRSLGLASVAVGLGQASIEESTRFAKDRVQFGKPIAAFDGVRARLADMAASIDAGRALTLQASARLDAGQPAAREAAEAKLVATEAASQATRAGIKLHGGSGFLKDFAAERLNRDARMLPLLGGDSAAQRSVAARQLLD